MAPLVECHGVVKVLVSTGYRTVAVDRVSFALQAGEAVALMGPSGGGKSTLLALLGLLVAPTEGVVRVDGADAPAADAARARLRNGYFGFVHQEHAVVTSQSALRNVGMPLEYATPKVTAADRRVRSTTILARVGLADKTARRAGDLSGGERQRVAVARSLVNRPRVILADEPTASLDTRTGMGIVDLLLEARATGVGLMVATHDQMVADRCDRIISIRDGRLEGPAVQESLPPD